MTDVEQRLHEAADAARRAGATLDREAMLARIEGLPTVAGRGWRLPLAAAAVAAVVIGAVVVLAPPATQPTVQDPAGGDGTGRVAPTASPSPAPADGNGPDPKGPTPAPSGGTSPSPDRSATADCSAGGMSAAVPAQPELPVAVAELRARIAELATACDLAQLAALGGDDLSFTFGGSEDAAAHWRQGEESTEPDDVGPMEALVLALSTPPARTEAESAGPAGYWAWPRLHLMAPDSDPAELDAAMDEVVAAGLHTREELETMFEQFGGYLGWRVMIEVDPEEPDHPRWIVFIAGD